MQKQKKSRKQRLSKTERALRAAKAAMDAHMPESVQAPLWLEYIHLARHNLKSAQGMLWHHIQHLKLAKADGELWDADFERMLADEVEAFKDASVILARVDERERYWCGKAVLN